MSEFPRVVSGISSEVALPGVVASEAMGSLILTGQVMTGYQECCLVRWLTASTMVMSCSAAVAM